MCLDTHMKLALYKYAIIIIIIIITSIIKCGMKSLIHSQTPTIALLKFGNGFVISSHTLVDIVLMIHARIKTNLC